MIATLLALAFLVGSCGVIGAYIVVTELRYWDATHGD